MENYLVEMNNAEDEAMPEGLLCIFWDGLGIDVGIRKGEFVEYFHQKCKAKNGKSTPISNLSQLTVERLKYC